MKLIIVQNNLVEHLTGRVAQYGRDNGIAVHDFSSSDGTPVPIPDGEWSSILLYGSVGMIINARADPRLRQWVMMGDDFADCAVWASRLGHLFLNWDGIETTVAEAIKNPNPRHYRPMIVSKKLVGSVLTGEELAQRAVEKNLNPDYPVWSSPPLDISMEIRVFIVAGEIAGYSMYRRDGKPCFDNSDPRVEAGLAFADRVVAKGWMPSQTVVVDIALVDNRFWRIIEFNPLHSSGWYETDHGAVIDAFFAAHGGSDE